MHLDPPTYVIGLLGGPRATGRFVGRSHAAVIKWRKVGMIPPECQRTLLLAARTHGLDLTAEDLILGRTVAKAA